MVVCVIACVSCVCVVCSFSHFASSFDMEVSSTQAELCARDLSDFILKEGLVRVSCERLSGPHTTECACHVHHQLVDRCGMGTYKVPL